jgi:hypothetical protein
MMRADDDDAEEQELVMTEGGGIVTPPSSPSKRSVAASAVGDAAPDPKALSPSSNKKSIFSSSSSAGAKRSALLGAARGTILEAAFVDPAYSWPPRDGEGKNAIELQASINLMRSNGDGDGDDASDRTTDTTRDRMKMPSRPPRPEGVSRCGFLWRNNGPMACCKSDQAVVRQYASDLKQYEAERTAALQARKEYAAVKRLRAKTKARQYRRDNKYNLVPEGILVYRLDTSSHTITLVSNPHARTDLDQLPTDITVIRANPSPDKSRRGIEVTATDGRVYTMVACEQRSATAWLEAMNLMKARKVDPTKATSAQDVRVLSASSRNPFLPLPLWNCDAPLHFRLLDSFFLSRIHLCRVWTAQG